MAEAYLGQIVLFAGNFAPRGWAICDGRLMVISQYQALFAILGTTYGGDGRFNFALPDLRGRVPVGPRQGPGLTSHELGQTWGSQAATLSGDSQQGQDTPGGLGLNYIICLQGIFPSPY